MKNIWKAADLDVGLYIIKETSPKRSGDLSFACTVVFKIGYCFNTEKKYGKISVLTDGCFIPMAETLEDLADKLNADEHGYRPLTKEEYIRLINSTQQGFY